MALRQLFSRSGRMVIDAVILDPQPQCSSSHHDRPEQHSLAATNYFHQALER